MSQIPTPMRPRCPPTCMCEVCERSGGGDFAVRAYVEGDQDALLRLSSAVASILPSLAVRSPGDEPVGDSQVELFVSRPLNMLRLGVLVASPPTPGDKSSITFAGGDMHPLSGLRRTSLKVTLEQTLPPSHERR